MKVCYFSVNNDYFKKRKPVKMNTIPMPLLIYCTIASNGTNANYVQGTAVNTDNDRLESYTQAGIIPMLLINAKLQSELIHDNKS